ncbi:hypothetical protein ACN27G_14155 [Plantactinospora sp. WMMB334]|uniref:hypothetical protein n=1 Tax=Plantactinospora sp. WMMB334 TaxID=3404119 RepID=UPI003B954B3B
MTAADREGDAGLRPAPAGDGGQRAERGGSGIDRRAGSGGSGIDRRALVDRHAVELTGIVPESPLSVGNGEFCYTVDVTGLQTFPESYPVANPGGTGTPGTLLGTQAQWGWHSVPGGQAYDLAETRRAYPTPRGPVEYVDMRGALSGVAEAPESPAEAWLRNNPHRLDLGRIGLVWSARSTGGVSTRAPGPAELTDPHQRLDLWTGTIDSRFRLAGTPVRVGTVCHPERDLVAVRVESALLAEGLAVRIAFPYGSQEWSNAADWSRPSAHSSTLRPAPDGAVLCRTLDDTAYSVAVGLPDGARLLHVGAHEFLVTAGSPVLELVVAFTPGPGPAAVTALPSYAEVVAASGRHWAGFWGAGGAVELAGSRDERAVELERRVVLSQYLTAVHCAGSLPPQETGLMVNSWRGRFHLEMHWWHGAHFPLWGRPHLLERSLGWYAGILPRARETARRQGCAGARWPKQVGPDGRESPSPIGPFLLWQQPHPIFLAELVHRSSAEPETVLHRYADVVFESAAFMADHPVRADRGYQLGPPLVPAQESYAELRHQLSNPTFELAYWSWGLRTAQRWRERLGLAPEPSWERVAAGLVRPYVRDGVYTAVDVPPYTVRDDHPSMLYALGLVPPTGLVDPEIMRATLHGVLADWDWASTWGWDYPAIAMTATRLGEPQTAVDALLMPVPKNGHLPNGHNRQTAALPVYLPGNGGLLAAVALMARGADADAGRPTPGFPDDGQWTIRHEGLHPMP